MKNHMVQVRISDEEFLTLRENCTKAGMSSSEYMRALMSNVELQAMDNKREIMNEACKMFTVLNQMADTPEKNKLMEGVNQVCRFLK